MVKDNLSELAFYKSKLCSKSISVPPRTLKTKLEQNSAWRFLKSAAKDLSGVLQPKKRNSSTALLQ